jgi:hypothetical protein
VDEPFFAVSAVREDSDQVAGRVQRDPPEEDSNPVPAERDYSSIRKLNEESNVRTIITGTYKFIASALFIFKLLK